MLRRHLVPIMLLLVFFFVLVLPTFAQDATAEPTPESTPVVIVTPAPTPAPVLTPDNAISVSTLIYGLIIAILGGGTVGAIVTRFGVNKANLDAAEKLYLAQSPEAQERERQLFEGLRSITLRMLDIVDKVTDGQPNVDMLSKQVALSDKYLTAQNPPLNSEAAQAILNAAKSAGSQ